MHTYIHVHNGDSLRNKIQTRCLMRFMSILIQLRLQMPPLSFLFTQLVQTPTRWPTLFEAINYTRGNGDITSLTCLCIVHQLYYNMLTAMFYFYMYTL